MASAAYGSFLAACGFEYDGPAGKIGFDPVMQPENFRAPFTAAAGWGTFSQTIAEKEMKALIKVNWGRLKLQSVKMNPRELKVANVEVKMGGKFINARLLRNDSGSTIELDAPVVIAAGQELAIELR